jgi:hypothetical protein
MAREVRSTFRMVCSLTPFPAISLMSARLNTFATGGGALVCNAGTLAFVGAVAVAAGVVVAVGGVFDAAVGVAEGAATAGTTHTGPRRAVWRGAVELHPLNASARHDSASRGMILMASTSRNSFGKAP